MTNSDKRRIRLTMDDVTVEVEGPKDYVNEKFDELYNEYVNKDIGPFNQEHSSIDSGSRKEKLPSLAEIYNECTVPYKRDSILLIGWGLEKIEDYENFNRSEIQEKATSAKIEVGKNIPRDMTTLIEKGYLKELDERDGFKTYHLTRSGENYVENEMNLPDELVERFGGV